MISERIESLRKLMRQQHIDIYMIPTSDFHNSEYVGEYFLSRQYMSGFTGSAGTMLVTASEAGLWTDGRYFIQAEAELKGTGITLYKMGEENVPSIFEYISSQLKNNMCLGFDGRLIPAETGHKLKDICDCKNAKIVCDIDLIDKIWMNRSKLSENRIYLHDEKYNGLDSNTKLNMIKDEMNSLDCDAHIISSLDDIAWILNLRGSDIACNPVFLSYLLIMNNDTILFASSSAISTEVSRYLTRLNIRVLPYNAVYTYDYSAIRRILADEANINMLLEKRLALQTNICNAPNPSTMMKACKNRYEIKALKECNITDGIAMVRFLIWLEEAVKLGKETELSISEKLTGFRGLGEGFMGISFETIVGYNEHGAIIHYEPTKETDIPVLPEGLLLIDSGAQYMGGTTDITRTIALGDITEEMRHHYTLVLKANLRILSAVFIEGTTGSNLDILAREPLWKEHLSYNHGTGHGVGLFLNVHEGPQALSWQNRKSTGVPFKEGMIITDEPGIYLEGKYGIRIENDLLCKKSTKNEYGQFLCFEPLTLCPIDLNCLNTDELTKEEKQALNEYHKFVFDMLSDRLKPDEREWLSCATRAI